MCFSSSDTNLKKSDHYISADSLVVLLKNYLKSKGIDSYPSIDKNKKFKNCEKDIQFFPLFKSWSTVEVVCSSPNNNWKNSKTVHPIVAPHETSTVSPKVLKELSNYA